MSREPNVRELTELCRLTSVREALAMDKLARAANALSQLEARIEALRAERFPDIGLEGAELYEKWQIWRQKELHRLAIRQAALAAEHRRAALQSGRNVAEHEVVKRLRSRAERSAEARDARCAIYNS